MFFPCLSDYGRTTAIRRRGTFIHILDDDSLLNIFHHCLPAPLGESNSDTTHVFDGSKWEGERWWYKLVKVCSRWRRLILGSPSHLRLGLLCTSRKPVADMLAYAPFSQLPLIIDYAGHHHLTGEEKKVVLSALQNRDRVRGIRVQVHSQYLKTLIMAMDKEFPMLEYLEIATCITYGINLPLPKTFQAPPLRHLVLADAALPRVSPVPMSLAGLVSLTLDWTYPSTYIHPGDLLHRLSFAPQLEKLQINFDSGFPNPDAEDRRISPVPSMIHVTLLSLRTFAFKGPSSFFEALLPWMATPFLKNIQLIFFYQPTFVPHLPQFLSTIEDLRFAHVELTFNDDEISVMAHPHEAGVVHFLCLCLECDAFDRKLASAEQIFKSLGTIFTTVESLTLEIAGDGLSYDTSAELDSFTRTGTWREILRSFINVRTLLLDDETAEELSRSLLFDDEGLPMDLLPKLKELSYSAYGDLDDTFAEFAIARQESGHPAILIRPWVR
jgi:hypothetical protein